MRIVLEAGQHEQSWFVTLTYADEYIPYRGNLSLRDLQLFFKRLRKAGGQCRYFATGEYGEVNWRPHYHAILFGLRDVDRVRDAWKDGFVHVSGVGPESAAYVAGYCLKGANSASGMRWLGRSLTPEFAIMSRRPGIGAVAADRIASFYSGSPEGASILASVGVSSVVRYQQKKWPLGRYLKARVMDGLGIDLEKMSEVRQIQSREALRSLSQQELNDFFGEKVWKSERSGLNAEARVKRKRLERKL